MNKSTLEGGVAHTLPQDLLKALQESTEAASTWRTLTPLARNEWICWVVSMKQATTRHQHIQRATEELASGQRRPCCWMGCIHRTDKELSPSQKFLTKNPPR